MECKRTTYIVGLYQCQCLGSSGADSQAAGNPVPQTGLGSSSLLSSVEGIWLRLLRSVHTMAKGGSGTVSSWPYWSTRPEELLEPPEGSSFPTGMRCHLRFLCHHQNPRALSLISSQLWRAWLDRGKVQRPDKLPKSSWSSCFCFCFVLLF